MKNSANGARDFRGDRKEWGMQGRSDPDRQLLDASALCRHLVADDSVHAFLADHRHQLFPDVMFEDLFPSGRGRPSVPADVIATVMVLQALEGLSDRDAAAALRTNIAWKVAAGLALDDEGINYSVLTYWRTRLRQSERPERIFDAARRRRGDPGHGHPVGLGDPPRAAPGARDPRRGGERP